LQAGKGAWILYLDFSFRGQFERAAIAQEELGSLYGISDDLSLVFDRDAGLALYRCPLGPI